MSDDWSKTPYVFGHPPQPVRFEGYTFPASPFTMLFTLPKMTYTNPRLTVDGDGKIRAEAADVRPSADLIERLARECDVWAHPGAVIGDADGFNDGLRRFASLVARECARMADSSGMQQAILEKFTEQK